MTSTPSPQTMFSSLSPGEWLAAVGAAWILIVDFTIGNRISEDYFASVLLIVAPLSFALLLAVFTKHGGSGSAWNGLYPGTLNATGLGIVVFVVLDLLNGLANEFSSSGEFYEITLYLAAAAVLAGLVVLKQESASTA